MTGADLTEGHWDAFFAFYMDTGSRKWGTPYLTRPFFSLIGETMRDEILLVLARRDGRAIAGALNFIGADTLYGRYWGALEEHPACISRSATTRPSTSPLPVSSRASRPARKARTSSPAAICRCRPTVPIGSGIPGLRRAVADYLRRERAAVAREIARSARSRLIGARFVLGERNSPIAVAWQRPTIPTEILVDLGAATTSK